MSDWENESEPEVAAPPKAPAPKAPPPKKSKWEGEDEDDNGVADDWDASSGDEEKQKKPAMASNAAPPRKKGTLKAKLAEKEAVKAARAAAGDNSDDDDDDDDDSVDSEAVRRQNKEQELAADLSNANDLVGGSSGGASQASQLSALLTFSPKTKDDFVHLSERLINLVLKQHQSKPLYPLFVEHFARELAQPLKDIETRKVASTLTALANEKQKEARDKASGKTKKKPGAAKPVLGLGKSAGRLDTSAYEESLDDFGQDPNDFM